MIDFFALLDEPRLPGLDPASLKEKFHRLSVALHPDRLSSATTQERDQATRRSADLNAAYTALADPKNRLQHLLELERGPATGRVQSVPAALMDTFMEIGALLQSVDAFLARREKVASPLLRVGLFAEGQDWAERIGATQQALQKRQDNLTAQLHEMNAAWMAAPAPGSAHRAAALSLDALDGIYQTLGFLTKWQAELRERALHLIL